MPWWVIVLILFGVVSLARTGLHVVGCLLAILALIAVVLVLIGVIRVPF